MIGIKTEEIFTPSHNKLLLVSLGINFIIIPLLAYLLGTFFLLGDTYLFAGLAIASILPTSNMSIAFTMFARGNVAASIKLTVIGLILGAILAPWYLLLMVGRYLPMDVWATTKLVGLLVLLPLTMGILTHGLLLRRYSRDHFESRIKPYLPAISTWGALYIVFTSISMNAHRVIAEPRLLLMGLLVQVIFYGINYAITIKIGRTFFERKDAIALVYGTALRNLSISVGLAATAFGPHAALMVSLAFLLQGQAAAWFCRLFEKNRILPEKINHAGVGL